MTCNASPSPAVTPEEITYQYLPEEIAHTARGNRFFAAKVRDGGTCKMSSTSILLSKTT